MMSNEECDKKFFLDTPYPEIKVSSPNPDYAKILLKDYAGAISEFSAIAQYEYGAFRLAKAYPKISNALACIARTEMKHLKIIASLIVELGEDPKYGILRRNRTLFWDASFVNYDATVEAILKQNIQDETMQIAEYNETISAIPDPDIQAVLKRIIQDEQLHIQILNAIVKATPQLY